MNTPAVANILIRTDRDYSETFVFYSSQSDYCAGTPEVLEGVEYIAQIRPALNSATLTMQLDVDATEKAQGKITISSNAGDNDSVTSGTYYWDLLEILADGTKNALIEGAATITGTVSRES